MCDNYFTKNEGVIIMAKSDRIYYADPDFDDFMPDENYDDDVQTFYSDYQDDPQSDVLYCDDGDFADDIQEFSEYDDSQIIIKREPQKKSKKRTA